MVKPVNANEVDYVCTKNKIGRRQDSPLYRWASLNIRTARVTAAQIVSAVPIGMARLPETSLIIMSSTAGFYAVKPLDLVRLQKKQADDLMSGSANGTIFPDTAAARIFFFFVLIAREETTTSDVSLFSL